MKSLYYQHTLVDVLLISTKPRLLSYIEEYQSKHNPTYLEKYIELIQTTTTLSRSLIFHHIPASYCLYLSEHHINILLTKDTLEQLLDFEYTIILDYYNVLYAFSRSLHPTIHHILNYIHMPSSSWIRLEDVATHCKLNKSYVSTLFKKEMKQTITSYIQEHKIKQIQEILHYTTDSLIEIASVNNFSTYSYFSKMFKSYVGITPKQYYLQHNIHKE